MGWFNRKVTVPFMLFSSADVSPIDTIYSEFGGVSLSY